MEKKIKTFIYEGLGFPVELIDVPMKKVFGEWVIDINMNALQEFIFKGLIHKPCPLSGKEIKFMRKFLEISTTEFGKKLGISHATVIKWEKEKTKVSPMQESYIRIFLLENLQNKEFFNLYQEIRPEKLVKARRKKSNPLSVDINQSKDAI